MALDITDLVFTLEKTTKNTYQYKEEARPMETRKVGTLYLSHMLFPGGKPDKTIIVDIKTPVFVKKKKK
jgi:hypothetical protein